MGQLNSIASICSPALAHHALLLCCCLWHPNDSRSGWFVSSLLLKAIVTYVRILIYFLLPKLPLSFLLGFVAFVTPSLHPVSADREGKEGNKKNERRKATSHFGDKLS